MEAHNSGQSRRPVHPSAQAALLHKASSSIRLLHLSLAFYLQMPEKYRWAMLGSNQRPLPCEGEACSFAVVRHYPIFAFSSLIARYSRRGRPPSFAPVVVKLSSAHGLHSASSACPDLYSLGL